MSHKSINDFLIRMFVSVVLLGSALSVTAEEDYNCGSIPKDARLEDKLVLSPVIFQGRLVSRSSPRHRLHFVSLRVLKVFKGKLPRRLKRQIRLLFSLAEDNSPRPCGGPPAFLPKSSVKKYVFFVKKLSPGKYSAIGRPEIFNRRTRRAVKKVLCANCIKAPTVKDITSSSQTGFTTEEGGQLKLKCVLSNVGVPSAEITWLIDGRPVRIPSIRFSVKSKRRRSVLRVRGVLRSDAGDYTCRAKNIIGESNKTRKIVVRASKPLSRKVSSCPISSFCLNGGTCLFYEMIGELVCKCTEGFAGQRCQFKKAKISLPFDENQTSCGLYGHDFRLREICAAWRKSPDMTEMTLEEYLDWQRVDKELKKIKEERDQRQIQKFRLSSLKSGRIES